MAAREAAGQIACASERVSAEFGGAPRGAGERDAVDASGSASRSALSGASSLSALPAATKPGSQSQQQPRPPGLLPPKSQSHPSHLQRAHVTGDAAHANASANATAAAASSAARHAVSLNEYKRRLQQSSSSSPLPPDLQEQQPAKGPLLHYSNNSRLTAVNLLLYKMKLVFNYMQYNNCNY